jgi:hypothetical protein
VAGGGFLVEPSALLRQADAFWAEARLLAHLVDDLAGVRAVDAGESGLNALIARRVDEVISALAGAGLGMQGNAAGLGENAARYRAADEASQAGGRP